jgi:hypothetical protein
MGMLETFYRLLAGWADAYWQWASGMRLTPYPVLNGGLVTVALLDLIGLLILGARDAGKGQRVLLQPRLIYPLLALILFGLALFIFMPIFERLLDWATR